MSPMLVNPFVYGAAAPVFPTSGLVIQFDPHDTLNRTLSGSEITVLGDAISGNSLVRVGGTGPTLVAASLNGFDIARFTTSTSLHDTTPAGLPGATAGVANDGALFMVVKTSAPASGGGGTAFSTLSGSGGCDISGSSHSGPSFETVAMNTWGLSATSGGSNPLASTSDGTGRYRAAAFDIFLLNRIAGTWNIYQNGAANVVLTTTIAMPQWGTNIGMGYAPLGALNWAGDLALAGIYDHGLDSTERTNFFSALGTKYAITLI